MECICTWFDLYQKSKNLSKRSTGLISVLRILLRLYGLANGIVSFITLVVPSISFFATFNVTMNNANVWIIVGCAGLCGPLISRVLCKDPKDVTNPNWKASAAIRDTSMVQLVCALGFWLTLQAMVKWGLWGTMAPVMNNSFSLGMFGFILMQYWAWYQYLLFAHRRYLEKYDISSASTLFYGFTTLGLNGSRASSISQASRTSSIASKTSAVSSVSVSDGGKV